MNSRGQPRSGVVEVSWKPLHLETEAKAAWEAAKKRVANDFDRELAASRWNEIVERRQRGELTDVSAVETWASKIDKLAKSMHLMVSLHETGLQDYGRTDPKEFSWKRQMELRYAGAIPNFDIDRWKSFLDQVKLLVGVRTHESEWYASSREEDEIDAIHEETEAYEGDEEEDDLPASREITARERELLAARTSLVWFINTQVWSGPDEEPR